MRILYIHPGLSNLLIVVVTFKIMSMQRKKYTVSINAPKEKVWEILWSDNSYSKWTRVFCEGSYAKTDWQEGSRVHFLSPGGNGMYSIIEKKDDNRFMSFRHEGEMKDGVELPLDDKSRMWAGATENYTLSEEDGKTELIVDMDIVESHEAYFDENFPKGLLLVKGLAEGV